MQNFSKLKIGIGLMYLAIVTLVVILFFYYGANSFLDLNFLKNNKDKIFAFRDANFVLLAISYFFLSIVWVFLLGFGTPLVIVAGFAFGIFWGSFLSILGFSIGASLLYLFANHYFKDLVFKYLAVRFLSLKNHFNENEFSYFFFVRVIPGIPFPIKNVMPVLFNMKVKNYFFATLLGEAIPIIISVSIVSGFAGAIQSNENLNFSLLYSPEIFLPLLGLGIMVVLTNYLKKKYIKK
ncbi:MAG: VTT domain-containing protein [Proteobacteria bacterium]|jgi:uncharacterized membrane protein YdjX (TVP38/TMEM64 family)|nr:VTT domain-containing protein [Pseudomonadota bacterium]MDA0971291.1 VTT domain-containing protein [Pseudomonadota bacterium]MDA0995767.1 VTT domain-containing protein [Pseudomonadota bacterium]